MGEESKEIMVLGAIKRGKTNFSGISKETRIDPKELNSILERLESKRFIHIQEKKGWLGKKIEIRTTPDGTRELEGRIYEMQEKWGKMSVLYKDGNKQKLKNYMDDNKSFIPMMMFFGIIDMMMFSMMFSMMGAPMGDYVPAESMPDDMGDSGGDGDFGDGFDIGF